MFQSAFQEYGSGQLSICSDGIGMGRAQRAQALSVLVPPEDSPPSAAAPSPDLAPVDAPVAPVDLSGAIFAAVDPNPECAPGPPCLHAALMACVCRLPACKVRSA